MATTQQKLFNLWVEKNYEELLKQMPMHDMMHDAYVTVYCFRRPIVPTPERFRSLMDEAYHRHVLREFNHQMHFTLPDPLFWLYLDEDEDSAVLAEDDAPELPSRSVADLSAYSLRQLFAFVEKHFTKDACDIFRMAVVEQKSYSDIAKITGKKRCEVKSIIDYIEKQIRKCWKRTSDKSTNDNRK